MGTVRQYFLTYPEVRVPAACPYHGGRLRWSMLDRLWDVLPVEERRRWLMEGLTRRSPDEWSTVVYGLEEEGEEGGAPYGGA